ncbi:MAG: hypothetical protein ACR2LV_12180 [Solirubrobacteraceae bacterium]
MSAVKPIIAVKSGRIAAGIGTRVGALITASEATVDAPFLQAGVIRTDTIHDLLDTARLISAQPLPLGRRAAIVANDPGAGVGLRRRLPRGWVGGRRAAEASRLRARGIPSAAGHRRA